MPKNTEKEPKNFEAAMAELDGLVLRMESGDLPLEESMLAYQRGTALLDYCQKILNNAQSRIQVLDGGADGVLKDFSE